MKDYAIIALGSNLGSSRDLVEKAIFRLAEFSSEPLLRSSLWETEPVDCPPDSPPFINAVVALKPLPDETPESLLFKLQELEQQFGRRQKKIHNEPRPLDLDLITFRDEVRKTPQLTLPHPRAHLRDFVVGPLKEINPAFAAQLTDLGALV